MRRLALLVVVLPAAGCGQGYKLANVSGKVMIDGRPAANVHVAFEPIGGEDNPNPGPGSVGVTDEQGVYRLQTVWPKANGAVVGKHRVMIHAQGQVDDDELALKGLKPKKQAGPRQLPRRYNEETELTCEVPPGGTDRADFDLSSK